MTNPTPIVTDADREADSTLVSQLKSLAKQQASSGLVDAHRTMYGVAAHALAASQARIKLLTEALEEAGERLKNERNTPSIRVRTALRVIGRALSTPTSEQPEAGR